MTSSTESRQTPDPKIPLLTDIHELVETCLAAKTAPGMAYAVVADGVIVHSGGAGVTHAWCDRQPTVDTVFRIASMTKSFVAAAILILRDHGVLALDDAVDTHIPELRGLRLPTADSRMPTIRDLLTMGGGWPTDNPWADREESMTAEAYNALLRRGFSFNAAPGTVFEYSNLGYTMLGRVITNVAGMQFQDFIRTRILQPLGMHATGFSADEFPPEQLAAGHSASAGFWQEEPVTKTGEFAALGGLFSNCTDLARWVGLMTSAFPARDEPDAAVPLCRASLREMQQGMRKLPMTIAVTAGEEPFAITNAMYGFGLKVTDDPRIGVTAGHSGGYPGFETDMRWHPASGLGVIVLSNGCSGGAVQAGTGMLRGLIIRAGISVRRLRSNSGCAAAADVIDRVLDGWNDSALDGVVGSNFDADIPRPARRRAIAAALAVSGALNPGRQRVTGDTASHLVWWREGAKGWLRIEIDLTPQRPQKLQSLDVRAVHRPSAALLAAARRLEAALSTDHPQWPVVRGAGGTVSDEPPPRTAKLAFALDGAATLNPDPVSSFSANSASFELRGATLEWRLRVATDPGTGELTRWSLTHHPFGAKPYVVLLG